MKPSWSLEKSYSQIGESFFPPLRYSFEQHSCPLKQIIIVCGAPFLIKFDKGSCKNYVIADRRGGYVIDYVICARPLKLM